MGRNLLRLVGELMSPAVAAAAYALGLYGQTIAGHKVEWNWIAAAFAVAFVILVVVHINALNSELRALKEKRVHTSAELIYDEADRWYRVGVRNRSQTARAENVEVKLEEIDPIPLGFRTIELPCRLGRKDAEEDQRKHEVIGINPDAIEPFDLVKHMGSNLIAIFTTVFQQQVDLTMRSRTASRFGSLSEIPMIRCREAGGSKSSSRY